MSLTITEVVKQFKQDWTAQLEPDAVLAACRHVGYKWRERCLIHLSYKCISDNPVDNCPAVVFPLPI